MVLDKRPELFETEHNFVYPSKQCVSIATWASQGFSMKCTWQICDHIHFHVRTFQCTTLQLFYTLYIIVVSNCRHMFLISWSLKNLTHCHSMFFGNKQLICTFWIIPCSTTDQPEMYSIVHICLTTPIISNLFVHFE